MNCNECKWFVGNVNDHYGICKRYPLNQNKTKSDFCGEYTNKEPVVTGEFGAGAEIKRGRKPKNVD